MANNTKVVKNKNRMYYMVPLCGAVGGFILWVSRGGNYLCYKDTLLLIENLTIRALLYDIFIGSVAAVIALLFLKPLFYKKPPAEKKKQEPDFMKIAAISFLAGFMGISLITVSKNTALKMLNQKVSNIELTLENIRKIDQANDAIKRGTARVKNGASYFYTLKTELNLTPKFRKKLFNKTLFHYKIALARFSRAKEEDKANKLTYIQEAKTYHYCSELYALMSEFPEHSQNEQQRRYFEQMKLTFQEKTIFTLNVLTELDKNYGRAYYNRACYKFQFGFEAEDVARDLARAFELNSLYREIYRLDEDFTSNYRKFALVRAIVERSPD